MEKTKEEIKQRDFSENVKMAINKAAEELAKRMYDMKPEDFKEKIIEYKGQMIMNSTRNKQNIEEEAVKRAIRSKARDNKKRLILIIKKNFLSVKDFKMEDYSIDDIREFLIFYVMEVLDNDRTLLRYGRFIGEKKPNEKIATYGKKYDLKHNFEGYYDYIIKYRNNISEEKNGIDTFDERRVQIQYYLGMGVKEINDVGNQFNSAEDIWINGLNCIIDMVKGSMFYIKECIEQKKILNYYICYSSGKLIEEYLLALIVHVMKYSDVQRDYIERIRQRISESLEKAEKQIKKEYNFLNEYNKKDILQDYAISYYLNIMEKENEIMMATLTALYDSSCSDKRRGFYIDMKRLKNVPNAFLKYLFGDKYSNSSTAEMTRKIEIAQEVAWRMEEIMGSGININSKVDIKSIIDEIFYYDKKFVISTRKKGYDIEDIIYDLKKGKFTKTNNRDEEIIILNEKIKRGMDCNAFGKDYYLMKNSIYQEIYLLENRILNKRDNLNYIVQMPFYWLEIINALL